MSTRMVLPAAAGAALAAFLFAASVAPLHAAAQPSCSYTHTYLGNNPKEKEPGWNEEAQGVAHDDTHWYFSQNNVTSFVTFPVLRVRKGRLWRIPATRDLAADVSCDSAGVSCLRLEDTELGDRGYNHFGDIDWHDGFLFVGLDGPDLPPLVVVFAGDDTLELIDYVELGAQRGAPWVAVDPSGFLYSSTKEPDSNFHRVFLKYAVDWERLKNWRSLRDAHEPILQIDLSGIVDLRDELGDPLSLEHMQGAAFSDDGRILYLANGFSDGSPTFWGLHVFEATGVGSGAPCGAAAGDCIARRIARSTNGSGAFNFEFHPNWSRYEEPEGITYWDLDAPGAPVTGGVTSSGLPVGGQLHAVLLDNDLDADDVYLKHYRAEVSCLAEIGIVVLPPILTFDDVGVGGVRRSTIEITNHSATDLTVTDVRLKTGRSDPLRLTAGPQLPARVGPNKSITVEVAFAPKTSGLTMNVLTIASDDFDKPVVSVPVSGTGLSHADQAGTLVKGFDEAVAAGDLSGSGSGKFALIRLGTLRLMLVTARELIVAGYSGDACWLLRAAYGWTDGRSFPPDFVDGRAKRSLAADIGTLWLNLGCR